MNVLRKTACAVCAVVLLFSVASCSAGSEDKNVCEAKYVGADEIWYDTTEVVLRPADIGDGCNFVTEYMDMCSDKLYAGFAIVNSEDRSARNVIDVYGLNGEKQKSTDVIFDDEDQQWYKIIGLIPDEDFKTAFAIIDYHDFSTFNFGYGYTTVDLETGKTDGYKPLRDVPATSYHIENVYKVGDRCVLRVSGINEPVYTIRFLVLEGEKLIGVADPTELAKGDQLDFGMDLSYDQQSGLITVSATGHEGYYTATIDLATAKVVDLELSDGYDVRSFYTLSREGELLFMDAFGNIEKYKDGDPGDPQFVPDIKIKGSEYDVRFSDLKSSNVQIRKVLSLNENGAVLCFGNRSESYIDGKIEYKIRFLKKADVNPHAGKKILELCMGENGLSDYLSSAIISFNRSDKDAVVRIWENDQVYSRSKEASGYGISPEEIVDPDYNVLLDILSDKDAPDMVSSLLDLTAVDETCFSDLGEILEGSAKENIFGNIVDTSSVDGKCLSLPVVISCSGIMAKAEDVKEGSYGFTIEEYEEYVKGPSNGVEPFNFEEGFMNNRQSFLISCLDLSEYIKDGKFSVDNENFRKLADYAKEHFEQTRMEVKVGEPIYIDDAYLNSRPNPAGKYVTISDYQYFIANCGSKGKPKRLMGLPSVDRKGPSVMVLENILLADVSEAKDDCIRFINFLYDGSFVKEDDVIIRSIVNNREVLSYELPRIAEVNNAMVQSMFDIGYSFADLKFSNRGMESEDMRERFITMIESLSTLKTDITTYSDYYSIIFEELDPYFEGDRSIDDAIKYIDSRVGTMNSERS